MDPVAVTLPVAVVETTLLASVRMIAFLVVAPPFAQRGVPPERPQAGKIRAVDGLHAEARGDQVVLVDHDVEGVREGAVEVEDGVGVLHGGWA